MPRPRLNRIVNFFPLVNYFKPIGIPLNQLKEITLSVEEVEALRLSDLLDMDQVKAAKHMKVSQPTFNRLLREARKKVTEAIVEGKAIRVEGGTYTFKGRFRWGQPQYCICIQCGFRLLKQRGIPCATLRCPRCNGLMRRE